MINVAVMGYGTIGSGVVEVICRNNATISRKVKDAIRVKYVLDLREFDEEPVKSILIHDFEKIVSDDEVDIVVETMGGLHPAYEFTKRCLEAGKSVCTSNKELVADYGHELMETAASNHVNYMFGASCGGGIPIIRTLNSALTGDVIEEITGIMNGTTNYILSKMDSEAADFADVLKEAQELGFAELHPQADVEGYDPCRKIAILSSIAYSKQVDFRDIYTEGITKITAEDFKYADKIGARIKLLALSSNTEEGISAMVAPFFIDSENPLYGVNDVFNAILVKGNMLGTSMFYGRGAGKLPTASAVVGDVVEAARHLNETVNETWSGEKTKLIPHEKVSNSFFVRFKGSGEDDDRKVRELFGEVDFIRADDLQDESAFITNVMKEGDFADKIKKLPKVISVIRSKISP